MHGWSRGGQTWGAGRMLVRAGLLVAGRASGASHMDLPGRNAPPGRVPLPHGTRLCVFLYLGGACFFVAALPWQKRGATVDFPHGDAPPPLHSRWPMAPGFIAPARQPCLPAFFEISRGAWAGFDAGQWVTGPQTCPSGTPAGRPAADSGSSTSQPAPARLRRDQRVRGCICLMAQESTKWQISRQHALTMR